MPTCPQAAFHRACWPPKAWQTDISSGWTSLFSATTATSSPTTADYPKQPMPPRCANTGATAKPAYPSSTPPSAASKPPATYTLFSSSCAPLFLPRPQPRPQPRHRVDSLRPNRHRPRAQPSQLAPRRTRHGHRPLCPPFASKSIPTAATSAVTSPNWRTCRPPSSTRRGPSPMTSTHTAYPFPKAV